MSIGSGETDQNKIKIDLAKQIVYNINRISKKEVFVMKKNICLLLAVLLLLCMAPQVSAAQVVETGSCGENATYTLYSDGRLVIGGTGAIRNDAFRWRQDLTSVEIENGITDIGDFAFEVCSGITSLKLPDSLKTIGQGAFASCSSLTGTLVIPDSVTSLCGSHDPVESTLGAFDRCTGLTGVVIGSGVTAIPYGLLSGCGNLRSVTMPDSITVIASYALSACHRLNYIEIPAAVASIGPMAFVNDYSLTGVVFKGSAPDMDGPFFCGSFNAVGFYPAGDESWTDVWEGNLISLMPYTVDSQGAFIPQAPDEEMALWRLYLLQEQYPEGTAYGDNFSYIINGNFITGYGSEAFAFQVSDALCDYLPLGEVRAVDAAAVHAGDILYFGEECCTVVAVSGDTVTVAGAEDTVYYGRTLTLDQVNTATGIRARVGVAVYPGLVDPALDFVLEDLPTTMPSEQQVYNTILALEDSFPEGMPYSSKNHFYTKTKPPIYYQDGVPCIVNIAGHGCSAFAYIVSDLCFGNLPARYVLAADMEYDELKVGDSLVGYGHQVVILEVQPEYIVVVEGNYNETIHWGRTLTREEVQGHYDLYTRYPAGYPFTDIPEGGFYYKPVLWAVKRGITNGISATEFGPNAPCNRAQIVTFLWRAAGSPEPTAAENPFVDVQAGSFYEKAVLWAVEQGITTGTDADHFSPNAVCNRATVVTFLYRAAKSPAVENGSNPFTDVPADTWYTAPVLWAVEQGITNGLSAAEFGPHASCNRAQIVTFLYRAYK